MGKKVKKQKKEADPIEILKENVLVLAGKVDELTNKLNEVVSVLQDNNLSRKILVDYIYSEEEEKDKEDSEEPEDSEDEDSEDEDEEEVLEDEEEEVKPSKKK